MADYLDLTTFTWVLVVQTLVDMFAHPSHTQLLKCVLSCGSLFNIRLKPPPTKNQMPGMKKLNSRLCWCQCDPKLLSTRFSIVTFKIMNFHRWEQRLSAKMSPCLLCRAVRLVHCRVVSSLTVLADIICTLSSTSKCFLNNLSPSHLIGTRIHRKVENANKISCVVKMYTESSTYLKAQRGEKSGRFCVLIDANRSAIGAVVKDRK